MFSQFPGQKETHGSLNFSAGDCRPFVIVSKFGGLSSDSLEDIVDKAVHDAHGLARNTSVWVDLFQHFVDVNGVGFLPLPLLFLLPTSLAFGLGGRFFSSLGTDLWWHDDRSQYDGARWRPFYYKNRVRIENADQARTSK